MSHGTSYLIFFFKFFFGLTPGGCNFFSSCCSTAFQYQRRNVFSLGYVPHQNAATCPAFDLCFFFLFKRRKEFCFRGTKINCFLRNAFMMLGQLWERKKENLCLNKGQGKVRKQSAGQQKHFSYSSEQFL